MHSSIKSSQHDVGRRGRDMDDIMPDPSGREPSPPGLRDALKSTSPQCPRFHATSSDRWAIKDEQLQGLREHADDVEKRRKEISAEEVNDRINTIGATVLLINKHERTFTSHGKTQTNRFQPFTSLHTSYTPSAATREPQPEKEQWHPLTCEPLAAFPIAIETDLDFVEFMMLIDMLAEQDDLPADAPCASGVPGEPVVPQPARTQQHTAAAQPQFINQSGPSGTEAEMEPKAASGDTGDDSDWHPGASSADSALAGARKQCSKGAAAEAARSARRCVPPALHSLHPHRGV
jgi:hypothetical protein